jgi:hypothetical protein
MIIAALMILLAKQNNLVTDNSVYSEKDDLDSLLDKIKTVKVK